MLKAKKEIGCVYPLAEPLTMEIKGRSLQTGLPAKVTITSTEMLEALISNFDISTVLALGNIDVFVRTMKENEIIEE